MDWMDVLGVATVVLNLVASVAGTCGVLRVFNGVAAIVCFMMVVGRRRA